MSSARAIVEQQHHLTKEASMPDQLLNTQHYLIEFALDTGIGLTNRARGITPAPFDQMVQLTQQAAARFVALYASNQIQPHAPPQVADGPELDDAKQRLQAGLRQLPGDWPDLLTKQRGLDATFFAERRPDDDRPILLSALRPSATGIGMPNLRARQLADSSYVQSIRVRVQEDHRVSVLARVHGSMRSTAHAVLMRMYERHEDQPELCIWGECSCENG